MSRKKEKLSWEREQGKQCEGTHGSGTSRRVSNARPGVVRSQGSLSRGGTQSDVEEGDRPRLGGGG